MRALNGRFEEIAARLGAEVRRLSRSLDRLRASLGGPADEDAGPVSGPRLFIGVSDYSWQATIVSQDGQPNETFSEKLAHQDDGTVRPPALLRRALRRISAGRRETVGSVYLMIADPDVSLLDSRTAGIRSLDPTLIRQVAAQQLGRGEATYGFQRFGKSSEREIVRGVYAFLDVDAMKDYLVALDSLATKLVHVAPATGLILSGEAAAPFAALDLRFTSSTLVFADPETGTVASRELPIGVHTFARALADETSVSLKEALEGLARRECFSTRDIGDGDSPHSTATEQALTPLLSRLRQEFEETLEYFVFQRLAAPPSKLIVTGGIDDIRGFAEWLAPNIKMTVERGQGLFDRFVGETPSAHSNLLEGAPAGMLTIGRSEYRFVEGRFRTERQAEPRTVRTLGGLALYGGKARAVLRLTPPWSLAACAGLAMFIGLAWFVAGVNDAKLNGASQTLSAALEEDAALRRADRQGEAAQRAEPDAERFPWTRRLIAIAVAAPDSMRLTRLTLTAPGAAGAKERRLSIEGVVPAVDGEYLGEIMQLVNRLSAHAAFQALAKSIALDTAALSRDGNTHAAQFAMSAALKPEDGARAPKKDGVK